MEKYAVYADILEEQTLLKCLYYREQSTHSMHTKILQAFFTDVDFKKHQIFMKLQKTAMAKAIVKKKNKTGGIMILDTNLYYTKLSSSRKYDTRRNPDTQIHGT